MPLNVHVLYEKEQQYRFTVCPQDLSYEGLEHILDISHRCVMCNLVKMPYKYRQDSPQDHTGNDQYRRYIHSHTPITLYKYTPDIQQ